MNLLSVMWARSRRRVLRVAVACVAAALLTAGLTAAPAHAAPGAAGSPAVTSAGAAAASAVKAAAAGAVADARTATHTATAAMRAGRAATASVTGTAAAATGPNPVVANFPFPDYPPAEMSAIMYNWWPESLGLPDNSPLDQLVSGTWNVWNAQNPSSDWLPPQPADLAGASVSITSDGGTGSTVSITVPLPPSGGTVGALGLDPTTSAILAQLGGTAAFLLGYAICGAFFFGLPTTDSGWAPEFGNAPAKPKAICNGILTAMWGVVGGTISYYATKGDAPTSGYPWTATLGVIAGGLAGGIFVATPYGGALVKALQYAWLGLSIYLTARIGDNWGTSLLSFLVPYLTNDAIDRLSQIYENFSGSVLDQASNPIAAARAFGLWTPVASGYVGNVPSGGVVTTGSGDCMDAYGSNGSNEPASPPAVPGQSVAINACNGNPAQVFTFWPTGQIEAWGLCMDDNGDTSSSDTPVINLQMCNGGSTQMWWENNVGEIVNVATGNCLDDPGKNTTPGTQLVLDPCNGLASQLWAPPGGTAAVTATGYMADASGFYCMMPQTTLSSPEGSNVITNTLSSGGCTDRQRSWLRGSTGALMATNGTATWCMDSRGPATTGPGGENANFVQLQPCDGSQSQVWNSVSTTFGPTLVNAADGRCINTPSGLLPPYPYVISMVVAACASPPTSGELWTLPGIPAPHGSSAGGPCDIYVSYGTPCVAAYSMTRALYTAYSGPLYKVTRASDGTSQGIGVMGAGGYVNASAQDSFCAGTTCTITLIYDQSPEGNNLSVGPPGGTVHTADQPAVASALKITIGGGDEAYGVAIEPGMGYRNNSTHGIATGSQPEGMYMVASGTHVNSGCCFDFGNAETTSNDDGAGAMDSVNLSTTCWNGGQCTGNGPWVEADLENGLFMGSNNTETANQGNSSNFVTAMLKNDGMTNFELAGGNAQSGGLSTWWNGALPGGYSPMRKQGAIIMGTGGDNSDWDTGSFFEGVMTSGYPSDAADAAVQANIVAAGYGGNSNPGSSQVASATASAAGQAVVHAAGATGAGTAGFSSVYTVDPNGDLQETYLPYMGASWITQDLSAKYQTPAVMPGTEPVSIVHCGYTSVFTVDARNGDLQETYLPAIGGPWFTQDLSQTGGAGLPGAPPTNVTPTAVVHYAGVAGASPSSGCGYLSVYSRDRNGDLQETYLSNAGFPGDSWVTQDLSQTGGAGLPGAPQVQAGTSPVAIIHCGYTSVFTVDSGSRDLQETYLPAVGGPWSTQDLSANYGTPPAESSPTAVVHTAGVNGATDGCGFTSVYTVDRGSRHLEETYLSNAGFPGDPWNFQDLSETGGAGLPGTPPVAPGTSPVALVHMGFTSVYTVDEGTDQLQETYLSAVPGAWTTQSLSANYSIPTTDHTPIVLLHSDTGGVMDWASVFTVNEFNSHLQESYLPNTGFPGDPWLTHDLSSTAATMPDTPPPNTEPQPAATWSVVHSPNTSTFTVNAADGHLQESYVTAIGQSWNTQDLSAISSPSAPPVALGSTPAALFHDGYTSAFTVDRGSYDLQETYLPVLGGPWHSQDLSTTSGFGLPGAPQVEAGTNPAAVVHDGFVSVFTFDKGSSDLQETYLPAIGGSWSTHDLSTLGKTPTPLAGTSPVALVHDGYTSVFTVDQNGDLQETYLPFMGDGWSTQDLTAKYSVPRTKVTPAAVLHDGYVSVFTIDYNGDLQENYLPYMGDQWYSQDLTSEFPGVAQDINVAPAALYHDGYTSVYYYTGPNDHLVEASLPAIGDSWNSQDMSANYTTPGSVESPSALVHYAPDGGLTWASVYTTDFNNGALQETYLPDQGFPGNSWIRQDLSTNYHTPSVQQPGGTIYAASSSAENMGYVRMVRLQHAGIDNGSLLATFEHSNGPGGMGDYIIRQSFDDGATWSSLSTVTGGGDVYDYAPFLYEFPKQLGSYPAGTLMLLGDTLNGTQTNSRIVEWLSFDHGATWTYKGVVQSAASGPGGGVWEPFVTLDGNGNLVMLFSDERQNSTWSQFIGEIGSADGGNSWSANPDGSDNPAYASGETQVIASPWQADRPGMPTVTRLPNGTYVMSYEMCGPHACDVFTKTSSDGDNWGTSPADFGTRAETGDGLHLQVSPVITSIGNELFLTAHRAYNANGPYPANQTVILTNTSGGTGGWDWIAAPPIPTAGAPAICNTNYSPYMIPAGPDTLYSSPPRDSLIFSTAAAGGPNNCQEVSDSVAVAP